MLEFCDPLCQLDQWSMVHLDQWKFLTWTCSHQMIDKFDLQVVEWHAQCCEISESQIVFHKGYYFLKGIWRIDWLYIIRSSNLEKHRRTDIGLLFFSKNSSSFLQIGMILYNFL